MVPGWRTAAALAETVTTLALPCVGPWLMHTRLLAAVAAAAAADPPPRALPPMLAVARRASLQRQSLAPDSQQAFTLPLCP